MIIRTMNVIAPSVLIRFENLASKYSYEVVSCNSGRAKKGSATNATKGTMKMYDGTNANIARPFVYVYPGMPKKETPDVMPEIKDTAVTIGFEFLPARKYDEDDFPAPFDATRPTTTETTTYNAITVRSAGLLN